MGKFGIGARVRDDDGDVGHVVAKPAKGYRDVKYETGIAAGLVVNGVRKSLLSLVEFTVTAGRAYKNRLGDRIDLTINPSAEAEEGKNGERYPFWDSKTRTSYTEYGRSGFDVTEDQADDVVAEWVDESDPATQPAAEAWVPKVGDRVRRENDDHGKFAVGDFGIIVGFPFEGNVTLEGDTAGFSHQLANLTFEPINLESGIHYVTRGGLKIGPAKLAQFPSDKCRWSLGEFFLYQDNGICGGGSHPTDDIVGEWVEPVAEEPAAEPKFKVGDRVKSAGNSMWEYQVAAVNGDKLDVNVIERDGTLGGIYTGRLSSMFTVVEPAPVKPIPTPTPTDSFIVARLTAAGHPRPNARPAVHTTLESAEAEAQRLADRLGDEFAVYQRVAVREVDAGPVPKGWLKAEIDVGRVQAALAGDFTEIGSAFDWFSSKQGSSFWAEQYTNLTPLGRAILRKWIATATSESISA